MASVRSLPVFRDPKPVRRGTTVIGLSPQWGQRRVSLSLPIARFGSVTEAQQYAERLSRDIGDVVRALALPMRHTNRDMINVRKRANRWDLPPGIHFEGRVPQDGIPTRGSIIASWSTLETSCNKKRFSVKKHGFFEAVFLAASFRRAQVKAEMKRLAVYEERWLSAITAIAQQHALRMSILRVSERRKD